MSRDDLAALVAEAHRQPDLFAAMHSPTENINAAKRSRGRPKGSTVFRDQDLAVLSRFADLNLQSPGSKLAPFLRREGHALEKDIRRMHIRWRKEQESLLRDAQLRQDAKAPDNLAQLVLDLLGSFSGLPNAVAPGLERLAHSLERARRRTRALEEFGLERGLPVDLADETALSAAIQRYEARVHQAEPVKMAAFGEMRVDQLPLSLKLYAAALMLHEASLQAAEREAEVPNDRLPGPGATATIKGDQE